jgi:hypothetical protein
LALFALTAAAALVLTTCGPLPAVGLRGSPENVAALTGEWDGSFESRASNRSGSIWFKLVAGEDHAHGDVLMKADRDTAPYARYSPEGGLRAPANTAQAFLTIHFVRASGKAIDGVLDTYWDPSCGCQAVTTFTGWLFENQITGTFLTHFNDDTIATGAWHVTRRRPRK